MHPEIKNVIQELHRIGAVKKGEFKLKSGIISPIYIDLRLIVSFPELLKKIAALLHQKIATLSFDRICGVPYTAIPIATALSINYNLPMVLKRKEMKAHGTGKMVEGVFESGMQTVVIEDIITSGISIVETISSLEEVGLKIKDIIVVIDREQGGRQTLEAKGYKLHSLFTLNELLHA